MLQSMENLAETLKGAAPQPIDILLVPKFEVGEMTGDAVGEAQLFYEAYCMGAPEIELAASTEHTRFFVKDRVAILVTGPGKTAMGIGLMAVLTDPRFDFTNAYIMSVGCAGGAAGRCTLGDVVVVSAACDYDLGHKADFRDTAAGRALKRELDEGSPEDVDVSTTEGAYADTTWYNDASFDACAYRILNERVVKRAFELAKDAELGTTEHARAYMNMNFNGADWAMREPRVLKGTTLSGDDFWKGEYCRRNADAIAEFYGCPDPYIATEMEDVALVSIADCFGLLDRTLIIRVIVEADAFTNGRTPDMLWGEGADYVGTVMTEGNAVNDVFEAAMRNEFNACAPIIDAILAGEF